MRATSINLILVEASIAWGEEGKKSNQLLPSHHDDTHTMRETRVFVGLCAAYGCTIRKKINKSEENTQITCHWYWWRWYKLWRGKDWYAFTHMSSAYCRSEYRGRRGRAACACVCIFFTAQRQYNFRYLNEWKCFTRIWIDTILLCCNVF